MRRWFRPEHVSLYKFSRHRNVFLFLIKRRVCYRYFKLHRHEWSPDFLMAAWKMGACVDTGRSTHVQSVSIRTIVEFIMSDRKDWYDRCAYCSTMPSDSMVHSVTAFLVIYGLCLFSCVKPKRRVPFVRVIHVGLRRSGRCPDSILPRFYLDVR